MSDLLTIGEVARRSGVASSALRFYEQRGLITSERAGSGHRRYPRAVLRRIAFIVFAQRIGLTLDEIGAELAKLPPHQPRPAATGRASRPPGRRGSTSASPSSSASSSGSPSASAAAASRSTAASSPTPATAPPPRARPALLDRRPARGLSGARENARGRKATSSMPKRCTPSRRSAARAGSPSPYAQANATVRLAGARAARE